MSSFEVGTNQGLTDSPTIGAHLNQEVDLVVSCIVLEPEKEEEIEPNMRVSFKERQQKCLSKSLPTAPSPAKKTRSTISHEVSVIDASMASVPPSNTVGFGQELVVSSFAEKVVCPLQEMTFVG